MYPWTEQTVCAAIIFLKKSEVSFCSYRTITQKKAKDKSNDITSL